MLCFTGVPKETADKVLKYTSIYETERDGELIKMTSGYIEDPSLSKTYRFKLNETFSDTDNFGEKFTVSKFLFLVLNIIFFLFIHSSHVHKVLECKIPNEITAREVLS